MNDSKKKKLTWKKATVLILMLAVVAGIFYFYPRFSKNRRAVATVSVSTLKKGSLRDTVSVSGEIKSKNMRSVFTTLAYPVKEVKVGVGDTVKTGQVLAVLDTDSLERDIESAEDTANNTKQSADLALQQAKSNYENAQYLSSHNLNMDLVNANAALSSAQQALDAAKAAYAKNHDQAALDAAQSAFDKANTTQAAVQNKAAQDLKALKNNYDAAVIKANDHSQQDNLDKMRQTLKSATITAPVDGTITASNATVGAAAAAAAGPLFTIQDTGSLTVNAEIKEYDVDQVTPGKKVILKTDATGDKEIAAEVSSVAPAATQGTGGTGSVTYAAEIKIVQPDPRLKIGMKARLNIILEEKSDVYAVPYDAVLHKNDGAAYVLAAEKDDKGVFRAKEVPVTTGLETDISIEISGSELKNDLQIVDTPENITAGAALKL